ncbi:hypothetical protein [Labilibacter marinus]|uniref:hypothetical protein n=1 Tax=Labilibacter marinus TaxID=1477105 RepID=UPI000950163F|nr:hypothetical protein [Labilibacter marinus]
MRNIIFVKFGGLLIELISHSSQLILNKDRGVKHFITSATSKKSNYSIHFQVVSSTELSDFKQKFKGEPEENDYINYDWFVSERNGEIALTVDYKDHECIKQIVAFVNSNSKDIRVEIELVNENYPVHIEPLMHPLGSLLMIYLFHWNEGALIHASAVSDNCNGYLFTGVSGIGKSTMARLWQECGAEVLNDDRLILRLIGDDVIVYNNPMPYYNQRALSSSLKKIFLLKQSSQNYIKPLQGVLAYSRVLGNFIQQFYNPQMVHKHLEIVESIINKVSVYEVGFKPDVNIVRLIREMDNDG